MKVSSINTELFQQHMGTFCNFTFVPAVVYFCLVDIFKTGKKISYCPYRMSLQQTGRAQFKVTVIWNKPTLKKCS